VVDFSLTEGDIRLMNVMRAERMTARTIAREIDRIPETDPLPNGSHPLVANSVAPYVALAEEKAPISGLAITECLMQTVGAPEFNTRPAPSPSGTWIVNELGTEAQKKAYGHLWLVFGVSEPGAGSDPSAMISHAKYDPATDEYILNGEKTFISNIDLGDGVVVVVKGEPDEKGKRPFYNIVLLKGTPGFILSKPWRKLGTHYHNLGGFVMQDVRVPAMNKLDRGFVNIQIRLNVNRPVQSALGLGMCRSILDFTHSKLAESGVTVDYAKGRLARSFVEDKLIRMEALWEATWGVIMQCKWLEQQWGQTSTEFQTQVAMAKAMAGKATRQITQGCIELLGPEGLSEEYLAEKYFRDARIIDIYEGPGEIHRLAIARKLLGYRKGELD
jgi:acyl-CoA dehydrogenase